MNEELLTENDYTELNEAQEPIIELSEQSLEHYDSLCRLCGTRNDNLVPIYSEEGISNELARKINLYLPIKVSDTDSLPLQCCIQCASTILTWHEYFEATIDADKRLRDLQTELSKVVLVNEDSCGPGPSCDLPEPEQEIDEDIVETKEEIDERSPLSEYPESLEPLLSTKVEEIIYEYICDVCQFMCTSDIELQEHCSQHEKNPRSRRKNNEATSDMTPSFICENCGRSFTRKYDMQRHRVKQHTGELSPEKTQKQKNIELLNRCRIIDELGNVFYKCETCKKLISVDYNFVRHQTVHSGEKKYYCHVCGKNFRVSSGLTRHINDFHHKIKKFACETCGKRFSARASLRDHTNIHTNERPFVCDVCGKTFKQKASLHIHKLFHSDVKRFECTVCGKSFRRSHELKVHGWMHTGHRPYSCKICGTMFRLTQDLKRHQKIHFKKETEILGIP